MLYTQVLWVIIAIYTAVFASTLVIFFVWPVKHPLARNWLTMFALSIGQGLMAALYILEVFARKSCKV